MPALQQASLTLAAAGRALLQLVDEAAGDGAGGAGDVGLDPAAAWARLAALRAAVPRERLAAAFVRASGDSAAKLEKLIGDPGKTYFTRFQELRQRLDPIRDSLPDGLGDVLTLDAVGDLLRLIRRGRAPERAVDRRGHRPNAPARGRAVPAEDDRTP